MKRILILLSLCCSLAISGQNGRHTWRQSGAQQRYIVPRPAQSQIRPQYQLPPPPPPSGASGFRNSKLEKYAVDESRVTISGFSSGGTMAQHMLVSFAEKFLGIAVFSHAYYRCSPGNGDEKEYDRVCTKLANDVQYNPENAVADIRRYWSERLISDPAKLANKKLYVYVGLNNTFFTPETSLGTLKVFEPFIKNSNNIRTRIQDANLVLPVDRPGRINDCATDPFSKPQPRLFIGNCGLNGPLEALQFLLGSEIKKPAVNIKLAPLLTIDQREFFTSMDDSDKMDDFGYLYVPSRCRLQHQHQHRGQAPQKCLLHIYFHGCLTGRKFVGDAHIRESGYLEIAEQNKIIMLFPQNINQTRSVIGCWDTYGATGPLYATRSGNQVRVVDNMLKRIVGDNSISFVDKRWAKEDYVQSPSGIEDYFGGIETFDPRK